MIKTLYEIKLNAAKPCLPLDPWMAFKNSSSSLRIVDLPKKIGTWEITGVFVEVTYPDGEIVSKFAVKNGSVWVVTIDGTEAVGKVLNGYRVCASGRDENGETVERYVLGVGDVYIKDLDGTITPGTTADTVRIYAAKPEDPKKGDAAFEDGKLEVYDGENWVSTGSGVRESERHQGWAESADEAEWAYGAQNADHAQVADSCERATYADEANIASWASQADYIEWSKVAHKPDIPSKTSDLENDENFVDRDFVNSSIATNTAHFLGTYDDSDDFPTTATPNDYVFYKTFDVHGNTLFKRYKWGEIDDGYGWMYEYTLNNSSFTSEQWETINGGPYATHADIDSIQTDIGAIYEELSYKATTDYVDSQIGQVLTEEF